MDRKLMLFVYATHFPVEVHGTDRATDMQATVSSTLAGWIRERFHLQVANWDEGSAKNEGALASWSTKEGDAGKLLRLSVAHADQGGSPWYWHVDTWMGIEDSGAWIRSRVGLEPRHEDAVVDPNISVGAPRFLHSLVSDFRVAVDSKLLGGWWQITPDQVGEYVALLENPDRRLPIVAVTRPHYGVSLVDPEQLARRLTGVAHVVAIEPAATYPVSDLITPKRSCFGGAVRLYWPGFTRKAPIHGHPLWMPRGTYLGSPAFLDDLAARLGRAAALIYAVPRLEATLHKEAAGRAVTEARLRREEQARQFEASRSAGGLTAEELEVFSAELDEESKRRADLEERVFDLQQQLEDEREARDLAQQQVNQAWAMVARGESDTIASLPGEVAEPPAAVLEAVHRAAETCEHLIFTQSAYESAEESQFSQPTQVLDDLLLLNEVAGHWAEGTMTGDFRHAFEGRHPNFRSGISQTASSQYGSDYEITHEGQTVMMGPHLCRGVGAPPTILRIYWFKDVENKTLVVGHVGRKLRDDSNRN